MLSVMSKDAIRADELANESGVKRMFGIAGLLTRADLQTICECSNRPRQRSHKLSSAPETIHGD